MIADTDAQPLRPIPTQLRHIEISAPQGGKLEHYDGCFSNSMGSLSMVKLPPRVRPADRATSDKSVTPCLPAPTAAPCSTHSRGTTLRESLHHRRICLRGGKMLSDSERRRHRMCAKCCRDCHEEHALELARQCQSAHAIQCTEHLIRLGVSELDTLEYRYHHLHQNGRIYRHK